MAHILSDYTEYPGQDFQDTKHPSTQEAKAGSLPSSPVDTYNEEENKPIFLQPETRPITQEQLVNEVKGTTPQHFFVIILII